MHVADAPRSTAVDQPAHPGRQEMSISAVMPAYNEEAVIAASVRHVAATLRRLVSDFEVVVTNDGSRDRTGAILRDLAMEQDLHLRVVTHERNRGYGAALASGFDAAGKDLVFMTDGDRQFDVAELADFLPLIERGADMVIGWRRHRADPPLRLLNAWGWKQLVNGLFGYTARDVDCAFKLFRREVWESVTVRSRGATFSAELLVRARRRGFQVVELPVSHYPRTAGAATGARPAVIARAFRELFLLRLSLVRDADGDAVARPSVGVVVSPASRRAAGESSPRPHPSIQPGSRAAGAATAIGAPNRAASPDTPAYQPTGRR
jgi:glycosyltransferase involved in cell wall biosynthesis